jgi:hypothetical protein
MSKLGTWPLYSALYKNKGSCIGLLTFDTNNTTTATVSWFMPPAPLDHFYAAGFTTNVALLGEKYTCPCAGGPSLAGTRQVTLSGGNMASNIVKSVVVDAHGHVTVSTPGSDKLKLAFQLATGQFSGSFIHPSLNKTVSFKGATLQADQSGAGYFLGNSQSGFVLTESSP